VSDAREMTPRLRPAGSVPLFLLGLALAITGWTCLFLSLMA